MQQELTRSSSATRGGKYLVFALDPNQYAVPIKVVREIIAMHEITPLPRMPHFVRGVINLRGRIIPVADLRVCLGMSSNEATRTSCIIVADIECDDEGTTTQIGCMVDSVCEVREIDEAEIQTPPHGTDGGHVNGLVRTDEAVFAILELEVLLGEIGAQARMLG
ncbi:MAG: chemotaxis protein CheW [Planctomycetota bacterium]